ncbi:MAG: DUF3473 domain-containing protein [Hyphomicrobiaceae bacterium]|nr:DUF3473 domain-containing protein [Hyphomicrobiaceae bacterium]
MPRLNQQNLLTINIEDYFQVGPLSSAIPQRFWQRFEKRVERNTLAALDLLDEFDHKAVFFTVGWLADQAPDLLREVVRRGHSVGSKGFFHRPLSQMSLSEFRSDAVRSRRALEKACGDAVVGYRVARGWFGEKDLWALDVLAQEGFQYDSSLLPLGLFSANPELRGVHQQTGPNGTIWELPISSWKLGPLALPISGGNYVRQLPDAFTESEIDRWTKRSEHPLVFYFHVWELDPDQPRISGVSRLEWLRQYRNLDEMPSRIRKYLSKYEFTSPERYLDLAPEKLAALEEPSVPVALSVVKAEGRPATIVVPCYNEEATLKYLSNTLDRFVAATDGQFKFSFVFVDDGSQDNTFKILQSMFADRAECKVVQHDRNRGVAAATLTGIRNADTDIACVLDADCSYDPATLLKMIPMLSCGVDLVTASPYHKQGEVLNVPRWRVFLSRGVSILYGTMLTNKIATYTACVRVYRKASVVNLKIENEGYFGITEILVRLDQAGARIVECPAVLESRVLGFSKMKVVRTIWGHLGLLSRLFGDKFSGQFRSKHGVVT